jgi:hypothetical protein
MASLQELKNNLSGKTLPPTKSNITSTAKKITSSKEGLFEFEEARYLLTLIAKTDFSGKDVQTVYNIAIKLQNIIKENLTEDNG